MKNYINEYHNSKSFVKESIKTLRANIEFASIDNEIKTIVITSTLPNEGKSLTSLFLSIAMAEAGKRTLLMEVDCRRPSLGSMLSKRPKTTWIKHLTEDEQLSKIICTTQQDNLFFADSDPYVTNPAELLSSKKFSAMLEQLKKVFDVIILDTPPLAAFIDAAILAAQADGTILVIASGKTDSKKVQGVIEQLKKANAKILGVVLNGVKQPQNSYYNYYYGKNKYEKTIEDNKTLGSSDTKESVFKTFKTKITSIFNK